MPNEENERKLEKLHKELMRLEQQLYEILTSNQLSESIKILEKIAFTIKLIKTNDDKGEKTETEVFKSLRENYKNFAKSIQHLNANEYESVLNIIKKTQQINNKIITLGKDNSDLQDENVESVQEENEHQNTYQISKVIEEQKTVKVEKIIEQQEEIFKIDWEYANYLSSIGQWKKRADYFENLASKIKKYSDVSKNKLVPVPIWKDRNPALIDQRYAEIFEICFNEHDNALKKENIENLFESEIPSEIDYKKIISLSSEKREAYVLDCINKIIRTPFKGEDGYLVSFSDVAYTIDRKYAKIYEQYKNLYEAPTSTIIEKISKTAEDYVNLKNKIMHRISISNMDYYDYKSQKDKEEMKVIVNDVNKYLKLQEDLKYFMKDSKDYHLLETPFDVDKIFSIYEKFNQKQKIKPNVLNFSKILVKAEKFKINWKEIARLSIKDKIETLEKAMIAMINAPKENTTSVNVDDTSYIINKKDERVFNKCYKEYKKAYFPVYNNNFSAKFSGNLSQMPEEPINNQIPKETKKFKIDYKKVSRMSIKEKVDYFGKLMLEIQNVPKENTISINIDDINYVINKKDEKVFRKCCSEYKKANLELQEEIEEQNIPSEYFEASTNEEETENLAEKLAEKYEGIGVELAEGNEINKVFENSSAANSGLQEGDTIISINNTDVTTYAASEIANIIKEAKEGEKINIKVVRNNEELSFDVKKEEVYIPAVTSKIIETENKKQEYYSTYNNGFVDTIDYAQLIKMQSQNDFGEKEVKQNTSEVINKNNINPFQRQDKILSDIINKIGYGIKVIKVLPASLSRTIMKRVQLGTVKVKAGTYDMLDENIYREENRYGR